jgi:hypothetical protein
MLQVFLKVEQLLNPHGPEFGFDQGEDGGCRVALRWGHPQSVWWSGRKRGLSKFGPALPYITRFKVFSRLIQLSA